ncbi:MAG: hypothetical protein Q7S44_04010 [bacterium]|nr:hypothetical protein [bacterium]
MVAKRYKDILEGFEHLDRDTNGPDKYVVRAIRGLVESNEILDESITQLHKIIGDFNIKSEKQTNKMIILTKVIAGLTVLMLVGLVFQIVLSQGK